MSKDRKVRHHYLPEFYLNGFQDPKNLPYLWIYEKGSSEIRQSSANDTAVEKHYFSFINADGNRDTNTIEDRLAEIEDEAARLTRKIIEDGGLYASEKGRFSGFLALMATRVPILREAISREVGKLDKDDFIEAAKDKNEFEAFVKDFEKERGKELTIPIEDFRQQVLEGDYIFKLENHEAQRLAFTLAPQTGVIISRMTWALVKAPSEQKFLTGDNPFFHCGVDPINPKVYRRTGLLNKSAEITFPLTRDFGLHLTHPHVKRRYPRVATASYVRNFNRRTVIASRKFVFASENSKTLLNFVQQYKNNPDEWPFA